VNLTVRNVNNIEHNIDNGLVRLPYLVTEIYSLSWL